MKYKCAICREAYFLTVEARGRHQQVCIALSDFYSTINAAVDDAEKQHPPHTSGSGLKRKPSDRNDAVVVSKKPKNCSSSKSGKSASPGPSKSLVSTNTDSLEKNDSHVGYWLKRGLESARDYVIYNKDDYFKDIAPFLDASLAVAKQLIKDELAISKSLKYQLVLEAEYSHPQGCVDTKNFKTSSVTVFGGNDGLSPLMEKHKQKLIKEESESSSKNSGWTLVCVKRLVLKVSRLVYKTPRDKVGSSYIALPVKLFKRKACVNVQNSDERCFEYSVLAKHIPDLRHDTVLTESDFTDNPDLTGKYDFTNLKFPLKVQDIKKFEHLNPETSVNVFEYDSERKLIDPLRIVDELVDHINLLLLRDDSGGSHYVYIQDAVKLLQPQLTKTTNKITICFRCSTFKQVRRCVPNAKAWLQEHHLLCKKFKPTKVELPQPGSNELRFKNYEMCVPVPLIVIADFEANLVATPGSDGTYERHEVNSYCTLVKTIDIPQSLLDDAGISTQPHLHRAPENVADDFLLYIADLTRRVESIYTRQVALLPLTEAQAERHKQLTTCELCETVFDDSLGDGGSVKVLDHCHLTGQYRRTLCNNCNLRCSVPNFIPVYFHNLSSYDSAFIIKALSTLKGCEIKVIPSSSQKFISFSVKLGRLWVRFLDSYRLMDSSLATLVHNLSESELVESSKLVPPEHIDCIRRKGAYPYSYVRNHNVFLETSLPPIDSFYNTLDESEISEQDFAHAKRVWENLHMSTFGDYHDFYLKLDVCLLADVITSFRTKCLNTYNIDCCHTYTAPGFAFQAMLHTTNITLELLTDYDQYMMVESGIRGGVVQSVLRYARANNEYLEPKDYDPEGEKSYLLYSDCINLYGYIMSQTIPTGNFTFVEQPEKVNWSNLSANSPFGYILEADVEVPHRLHDYFNELPLMPENCVPPGGSTNKLLTTLNNKKRYVAHYTVFQQAARLGLKVTKVWRALKFSQSSWMKNFIDLNARLRAESSNEFDRGFFKLMNNAVFGKTMENVRKRVDVRIVTSDEQMMKLTRQAKFLERTIITEGVVAVLLSRPKIVLNKPVYIGMCVLDMSKVHMYNFHYRVMCEHFKFPHASLEVCYMDTDGIIYRITINNGKSLNEMLMTEGLAEHFDRSSYPPGHELHLPDAKPILGRMKDECKGAVLFEFVGLRSKMYTYRFNSSEQERAVKKAKGVKLSFVKRNITFNQYKAALFEGKQFKANFNVIRSKDFNITSRNTEKVSLSATDDKRVVLGCGVKTMAHGHYRIQNENGTSEPDT